MNGIHDVGGSDGFGPITVEIDEPVFHAEWEKPVFSFFAQGAMAGYFNLDEFRYAMEQMPPVDYLVTPYYGHWMHSFETYMTRDQASFADELERRTQEFLADPSKPLPEDRNPELADALAGLAYAGAPTSREVDVEPAFAVGDRVRVSSSVPVNHTRKAGYARGATGEVVLTHGTWVYPDTNAHGEGENPEHVYSIRFTSEELYGAGHGEPNTTVTLDLWESYLSLADH